MPGFGDPCEIVNCILEVTSGWLHNSYVAPVYASIMYGT